MSVRRVLVVVALFTALLPAAPAVAADPAAAVPTVAPLWARVYADPQLSLQVADLAVDPSRGRVYSQATAVSNPLQFFESQLVTYTEDGAGGTVRDQPGPVPGSFPDAAGLAVDSDRGRVYALASSRTPAGYSTYLSAYGPSGAPVWTRSYTPPDGDAFGAHLAVDPDSGRIFVLSAVSVFRAPGYANLAAYAPSGTLLWTRQIRRWYTVEPAGLTVDPSRGAVTVAATGGGTLILTSLTGTGQPRWTDQRRPAPSRADLVTDPATGTVVVAGRVGSHPYDVLTAAWSAAGTPLWSTRIDAGPNDDVGGLAVDPVTGTVVVAGTADGGASETPYDAVLTAYTLDGALRWSRRYDGPAHGNDSATCVVIDSARGRVYAAGGSQAVADEGAPQELSLLSYRLDGTLLRADRYTPTPGDQSYGQAVDLDPTTGRVFVLASTSPDFSSDEVLTVAYPPA